MATSNVEETVDRVESEIEERTDSESVSTAVQYLRRAAGSGVPAGVGGGASLLRGFGSIRRGDRGRGIVHLLLGALFLAFAAVQRRSSGGDDGDGTDVDRTDVVDTSPDVESVDTESEEGSAGESDRYAGEEAAAVVDTSPDVEEVGSASDDEHDARGGAAESDRGANGDEATDVVDTSPDIEDVNAGTEEPDRDVSDDAAAAVADTSPDVEQAVTESGEGDENGSAGDANDAGGTSVTDAPQDAEGTDADGEDGSDAGSGGEEPDREAGDGATADADAPPGAEGASGTGADVGERTYERLGEAAFDEHGREVPVPQRAFDLNVLSLGGEAFWGIGEADDVVVSGLYDALGEGIRYVASSRVDEERTLQVPGAVTDHWDEVAGGGTAVTGGDELVFAIAEEAAGDRLLVVPERWSDVPGLEEAEE